MQAFCKGFNCLTFTQFGSYEIYGNDAGCHKYHAPSCYNCQFGGCISCNYSLWVSCVNGANLDLDIHEAYRYATSQILRSDPDLKSTCPPYKTNSSHLAGGRAPNGNSSEPTPVFQVLLLVLSGGVRGIVGGTKRGLNPNGLDIFFKFPLWSLMFHQKLKPNHLAKQPLEALVHDGHHVSSLKSLPKQSTYVKQVPTIRGKRILIVWYLLIPASEKSALRIQSITTPLYIFKLMVFFVQDYPPCKLT